MLQRHLMVELIGVPLVNSLKQSPSVVLVQEPDLLSVRSKITIPVVLITKETAISVDGDGDGMRPADTQEMQLICNCCGQPYYPNKSWEDRITAIIIWCAGLLDGFEACSNRELTSDDT